MSDILAIANWEDELDLYGYPTGKRTLVSSHGVDLSTDEPVVLPNEHPMHLGARFDDQYMEWIIR